GCDGKLGGRWRALPADHPRPSLEARQRKPAAAGGNHRRPSRARSRAAGPAWRGGSRPPPPEAAGRAIGGPWPRDQPRPPGAPRVQLGSRERMLREKVQISVTVVTAEASPSTTLPSLSRVTLI